MKMIHLIASLFLILLFYSCEICSSKTVDCGAYEDEYFEHWFPYHKDQQLVFKSEATQLTDTFNLGYYSASSAYQTTTGGYNSSNDACISSIDMAATNDSVFYNPKLYIRYSKSEGINSSEKSYSSSVRFYNVYFDCSEVTDSISRSLYNYNITVLNKLNSSFNGISYDHFVELMRDTSGYKLDGVYKVYIAKEHGIVGYETYPKLERWIKQ